MKKNKIILTLIIAVILIFAGFKIFGNKKPKETISTSVVKRGDIKLSINASGTVLPQNRLSIKPPLAGRIEQILVNEGDYVKKGQILAYMSSTDRAAILDAARAQGEKDLKEWEDIYKPIPVIAPINGQVIVRGVEPGQTVTQSDEIIVLSDRLIVKVQVDETDIGKVAKGQKAIITIDAYPDNKMHGIVDHIYYESKTVNNVTIYEVDVVPDTVPDFLRSGMSANVDIIQYEKKDILLVPSNAVKKSPDGKNFVVVSKNDQREMKIVETGITDGENTEIISGVEKGETVLIIKKDFSLITKKSDETTSPFMPQRQQRRTVKK
ncbi:MAG: efflux RND transporter periplasmic adaptor subunit [Candidatus Goldbacteria bacterium]|nr:efflux RND transporter periplasmic adaptor subunit [Candidatus Goldiibacteriota bacterium]